MSERPRVALSDVGWRWAEGYGAGKEGYWLLPRQLKLSDGRYIEFEQLKRG